MRAPAPTSDTNDSRWRSRAAPRLARAPRRAPPIPFRFSAIRTANAASPTAASSNASRASARSTSPPRRSSIAAVTPRTARETTARLTSKGTSAARICRSLAASVSSKRCSKCTWRDPAAGPKACHTRALNSSATAPHRNTEPRAPTGPFHCANRHRCTTSTSTLALAPTSLGSALRPTRPPEATWLHKPPKARRHPSPPGWQRCAPSPLDRLKACRGDPVKARPDDCVSTPNHPLLAYYLLRFRGYTFSRDAPGHDALNVETARERQSSASNAYCSLCLTQISRYASSRVQSATRSLTSATASYT